MPLDTSLRNTCIFLLIFILAFFPSAFQLLLKPLFWPFEVFTPEYSISKHPVCACCPPVDCSLSPHNTNTMSWFQKTFTLPSRSKGSYLVTDIILHELPEIKQYKVGLLTLFVQHTSCALTLNENFDSDVRADMTDALDRIAPEDTKGTMYRHADEGLDDMPAHIKSAVVGASVTVPITDGKLNTGTWQGIWHLEFRSSKHSRKVVATIQGEKK